MIGFVMVSPRPLVFGNRRGLPISVRFTLPAVALLLQSTIPTVWPFAAVLNLPLLAALHVMLASNSVVGAMLTGMLIGWAQDGLTHGPVGAFGLAYTTLGYVSVLANQMLRLSLRTVLGTFVAAAYLLYEILSFGTRKYLMDQSVGSEPLFWLAMAALHSGLAMLIFPLLPRQAASDSD